MLKVLIVEDERTVREGIAESIEEMQCGFRLCGQAGDGEEALRLIDRLAPDIVITDIRMPRMDGLELVQAAKREQPGLEFILLSGHNDFEYAKTALRLGVSDYLLKPCKPEELMDTLISAKQKIAKTRETEHSLHQSLAAVMEKTLVRWLQSPPQPLENRSRQLEMWGEPIEAAHIYAGIVRFDETGSPHTQSPSPYQPRDMELIRYAAENVMRETLQTPSRGSTIVFRCGSDLVWLANRQPADEVHLAACRTKLTQLRTNLEQFLRISVSIGVGGLADSIDELHLSYDQAAEALNARFYEGRGSILFYHDLLAGALAAADNAWQDKALERLEEQILHDLRTMNFEHALDGAETWIERLRSSPHYGQSGASLKTTAFLLELQKLAQEQHAAAFEWKLQMVDWLKQLPLIETIDDLSTLVKSLIRGLVAVLTSMTPTHRTVAAALDIIHAKYQTNLTLDAVAKEVFVSKTYLSSLFKQGLGINFLDYLHQYRVEQAKPLLKQHYKIYAVAKLVGYQEERHFSATFKKWSGLTPSQYQKSV
ncbi:response regulator [Paenibacillus aurantiacus]|uniref:Response regulator n=1 Tax=Paenibacillus aurantiacus TaxID=1936118 RepID=A0ABV5KLG0_9BACL